MRLRTIDRSDQSTEQHGFTIVELIVVIAVIGILAAVTVLSYGAWRKTTEQNSVKSDLNGAAAAMENSRNFGAGYPGSIPSTFTSSTNVQLSYVYGGTSDYCIQGQSTTDSSVVYNVQVKNSDPVVSEGACPAVVVTVAGSSYGYADGTGTAAHFGNPSGAAVDLAGNVYVADTNNHRIRKVTPSGVVTTLAGSTQGNADGTGTAAQFNAPTGVAVDSSGNLYVTDTNNNRIRKVTPAGVVTTLAGSVVGYVDGSGTVARFYTPTGIAVDASGNVYVADRGNYRIRKVTPSGVVTTLAGSTQGYADGTGTAAQFNNPQGVAIDASGNVYVADRGNNRIRKVSPSGVVTTLAGSTQGYADGTGTAAQFNTPVGVAVDASGNVYVADSGNNRIRKVSPSGVVTTLAGSTQGYADGTGTAVQFDFPNSVAVDPSGNIYVTDFNNQRIRVIN